jgi:hypothetical protein
MFELVINNSWTIAVGAVAVGVLMAMRRRRRAAPRSVDLTNSAEPYEVDEAAPGDDGDPTLDAVRERRDEALARHDYVQARSLAEEVLGHGEEDWLDLIELGTATALAGEPERGWQMVDEAVEQCERADARMVPALLVHRALSFLWSWAPPERFIAAVEEAEQASPGDENLTVPLLWSYAYQGRFDEAQELGRLRSWRDEGGMVASMLDVIATFRRAAEQTGTTLEDLHRRGFFTPLWDQLRAEQRGLGLVEALAALDEVVPGELRDVLRRPARKKTLSETGGEPKLLAWHNGQEAGAGAVWGLGGDFRLMTSAEIAAMDAAVEASPTAFPQWDAHDLHEIYAQIMTDDAGGHLITLAGARVVLRRDGVEDVVVAPSLADFFWDRVATWGGCDPRPQHR